MYSSKFKTSVRAIPLHATRGEIRKGGRVWPPHPGADCRCTSPDVELDCCRDPSAGNSSGCACGVRGRCELECMGIASLYSIQQNTASYSPAVLAGLPKLLCGDHQAAVQLWDNAGEPNQAEANLLDGQGRTERREVFWLGVGDELVRGLRDDAPAIRSLSIGACSALCCSVGGTAPVILGGPQGISTVDTR